MTYSMRYIIVGYQAVYRHLVKYSQTCLQGSVMSKFQKWPLLTGGVWSERQKLYMQFSRDKLILAFVDRKPLLAGVLMHRS